MSSLSPRVESLAIARRKQRDLLLVDSSPQLLGQDRAQRTVECNACRPQISGSLSGMLILMNGAIQLCLSDAVVRINL